MKTDIPAPGTWSGLQCSTRYGSLVNIIGRRQPEQADDLPAVWAIRTGDKAIARCLMLLDANYTNWRELVTEDAIISRLNSTKKG